MGKGRSPDSLEMYLYDKNKDRYEVKSLVSMDTRILNRMEIHGESYEEAASRIQYIDSHHFDD